MMRWYYYQHKKITTFPAKWLPKLHKPAPSNAITWPPYTCLFLSLFLTILVAPSKQFLNIKSLSTFLIQLSKSWTMLSIRILVTQSFFLQLKPIYWIATLFSDQNILISERLCNGKSLDVYNPFGFQEETSYSLFSSLKSYILNVGQWTNIFWKPPWPKSNVCKCSIFSLFLLA